MLKYLVSLTQDMTVVALIAGMLLSYFKFHRKSSSRILILIGMAAGFVASVIMAVLINTTNKVNIGYTNLTMFFMYLAAFVLFIIVGIPPIRNKLGQLGDYLAAAFAAIMVFAMIFFKLPDVLAYPYNFDLSGNTVFSTDFIYRFSGCLIGLALCCVAGWATFKIEKDLKGKLAWIFMDLMLLITALSYAGKSVQIMRTRMMIQPSDLTFNIIKITLNYSEYFILAVVACAVIAGIYLILDKLKVKEEYSNSAQLRKIKAGMRRCRRWSVLLILCAIAIGVNLTAVDAYNNREPEEAPVEDSEVVDDYVVVPIEQVNDGHLHRFGLEVEGIMVKFIVAQKPGSTAYGVGLDACDICGDAGYYERDDQIVCRRCDVVMNTNTIGFKGGCNPIVIDYKVEDGQIKVPVQELVDNKDEFK